MTGIDIMLTADTGATPAESARVETATSAAATNLFICDSSCRSAFAGTALDRQGFSAGSKRSYDAANSKVLSGPRSHRDFAVIRFPPIRVIGTPQLSPTFAELIVHPAKDFV